MRVNKWACFMLLAGVGTVLQPREVRAETTLCTVITTLPFATTGSGNYCLASSPNFSASSGKAITVNHNNVLIDLNGFRLGGLAGGTGTTAIGVYALNKKNVTVRNGIIRGFFKGVFFEETTPGASQAHVVEEVRAEQNKYVGVHLMGLGNIVRNNQVVETGGSTAAGFVPDGPSIGIWMDGPGVRVLNNDVSATVPTGAADGTSVLMANASGSVAENNRIGNQTILTTTRGVVIESGDAQVIACRLTTLGFGVLFSGTGTGKYRDNLSSSVTTPFQGGLDAGNNQ